MTRPFHARLLAGAWRATLAVALATGVALAPVAAGGGLAGSGPLAAWPAACGLRSGVVDCLSATWPSSHRVRPQAIDAEITNSTKTIILSLIARHSI